MPLLMQGQQHALIMWHPECYPPVLPTKVSGWITRSLDLDGSSTDHLTNNNGRKLRAAVPQARLALQLMRFMIRVCFSDIRSHTESAIGEASV